MDQLQARYDALIKEAELLRAEVLLCISNVRRITGFVASIAGAGIPLLAALINVGPTSEAPVSIATMEQLNDAILTNAVIVQMVTISIAVVCTAFLLTYVGIFMQIFMIARYFREHLTIEINALVAQSTDGRPVFYWENFLTGSRSRRGLNVGDLELAIEPVLMATFSVGYALVASYVSYFSTNAMITHSIAVFVLIACLYSIIRIVLVLIGAMHAKKAQPSGRSK